MEQQKRNALDVGMDHLTGDRRPAGHGASPQCNPFIFYARRAHSSKPAAAAYSGRMGQTDGRRA